MPDNVKVVTTVAMQGVLEQLERDLQEVTGLGIAMAFGPPSKATRMIRDGEAADVVMTTPEDIGELVAENKIVAGSSHVVARMIMGIAVRKGAPKPDIGTAQKFKQAILSAKSLIHADPRSGSPSAAHFLKVAERLGIADEIRPKTTTFAGIVAHAVARGEVEVAIQQMSELLLVEGVDVVGPFPPELQNVVPLAAAIHAKAAAPKAALALIELLRTPRAKHVIEKAGMLPGP